MEGIWVSGLRYFVAPPRVLANRLRFVLVNLLQLPFIIAAVVRSRVAGDGNAERVLRYANSVAWIDSSAGASIPTPPPREGEVRLFSWQLSYFSGKIRGYLQHKARTCGLVVDEVTATPEVIAAVLMRATRTNTVPQVQLPDGQ